MIWNNHYRDVPEGAHAFLGASKYSWLNYDPDKLISVYRNSLAVKRGTELHELAANNIRHGIHVRRTKKTWYMYVNDAVDQRMIPEQPLYYSPNCFGTADAILFKERSGELRIHDLKTGTTPASLHQLEIYAALFCLEYGPQMNFKPGDISIELSIYQNDDILIGQPEADDIVPIIDKIIAFDRILNEINQEEESYI